jgi:hypothetical protein
VGARHRPAAPPRQPDRPPLGPPPLREEAPAARRPQSGEAGPDLRAPPGTAPATPAVDWNATPTAWAKLGDKLAALGPDSFRRAVAARAARAAAGGGDISVDEEERLARWFARIIDEAIRRGGLAAGVAIWSLLTGDNHADPVLGRAVRCPAMASIPEPPRGFRFVEPGVARASCFPESATVRPPRPRRAPEPPTIDPAALDPAEVALFMGQLRDAAPAYVHTAVAGASESELQVLRDIARANDDELEYFRPWAVDLASDVPASASLENARSMLTARYLSNPEACSGFAEWAHGLTSMVAEHALPPVLRIGAIAWLARVALRPEDGAA